MEFIYKLNKSQLESSDHVTLVHLYIQPTSARELKSGDILLWDSIFRF